MSDTVLLEEEVNHLISAAQANGLEIVAIHNHFFYENPRIFYMHLHGMGTSEALAKKFAATIKDAKISHRNQPAPSAPPTVTGKELFDTPALDEIVKYTRGVNGPTHKYTVGDQCSFDYIVKKHGLTDPAVHQLADIVRAADTDCFELAPQAAGLWAISAGLSHTIINDHQMLIVGLKIYDALYAWAKHLQNDIYENPDRNKSR